VAPFGVPAISSLGVADGFLDTTAELIRTPLKIGSSGAGIGVRVTCTMGGFSFPLASIRLLLRRRSSRRAREGYP
jgi:hypothetical protein